MINYNNTIILELHYNNINLYILYKNSRSLGRGQMRVISDFWGMACSSWGVSGPSSSSSSRSSSSS